MEVWLPQIEQRLNETNILEIWKLNQLHAFICILMTVDCIYHKVYLFFFSFNPIQYGIFFALNNMGGG